MEIPNINLSVGTSLETEMKPLYLNKYYKYDCPSCGETWHKSIMIGHGHTEPQCMLCGRYKAYGEIHIHLCTQFPQEPYDKPPWTETYQI